MTHDSIPCITILTTDQMQDWMDGNLQGRGDRHFRRLAGFWQDVENGTRVIWAAWQKQQDGTQRLLGQISVQPESYYPPFRRGKICEIVDLWVHPDSRKQGVGRQLLDAAIDYARQHGCSAIGLGVGITGDFGPAQRLYVSAGFMPDGSGLWHHGTQSREGDTLTIGDSTIMMWVKTL